MTYDKINRACFYTSMLCVSLGLILSLAMVWEVFPNNRVIEKSWLSIGIIFGSAVVIAAINSAFSLRAVKKREE